MARWDTRRGFVAPTGSRETALWVLPLRMKETRAESLSQLVRRRVGTAGSPDANLWESIGTMYENCRGLSCPVP